MMAGASCYLAGLLVLATAQGMIGVTVGAGVLIGAALACTASAMGLAVAARAVPARIRSTVLGLVTAAGSLGSVIAAPHGPDPVRRATAGARASGASWRWPA